MAQAAPYADVPDGRNLQGHDRKTPFRPDDGDTRDHVHCPRRVDRRSAICRTVAGGRRVHLGGWRHVPEGQFMWGGRRPAQTRWRLARNNHARAVSQVGWRWYAGT